MTASGSVDYAADRDTIITETLELIGVLSIGDTADPDHVTSCARSLNMMVKSWMTPGVQLWKVSEATLTLVATQTSYTLGAGGDLVIDKPLRIIEARRRDSSGNETPLFPISRDEYMRLNDKDSTGYPTQYYFLPGLDTSTLYIWPVADSTIAASDTVKFSYYSLLEDFDASTDTPDFPVEWTEALVYNLAVRVAAKFGKNINDIPMAVSLARELKEMVISWGQEFESVYFGVDSQ